MPRLDFHTVPELWQIRRSTGRVFNLISAMRMYVITVNITISVPRENNNAFHFPVGHEERHSA